MSNKKNDSQPKIATIVDKTKVIRIDPDKAKANDNRPKIQTTDNQKNKD